MSRNAQNGKHSGHENAHHGISRNVVKREVQGYGFLKDSKPAEAWKEEWRSAGAWVEVQNDTAGGKRCWSKSANCTYVDPLTQKPHCWAREHYVKSVTGALFETPKDGKRSTSDTGGISHGASTPWTAGRCRQHGRLASHENGKVCKTS